MRFAVVLGLLAGCYTPGSEARCTVRCSVGGDCPASLTCNAASNLCEPAGGCTSSDDAGIDRDGTADPDATAGTCYGTGYIQVCVPPGLTLADTRELRVPQIDTSDETQCDFIARLDRELCVVAAHRLALLGPSTQTSVIAVSGSRGIVFLGTEEIEVATYVFAASYGTNQGPGNNPSLNNSPICTVGVGGSSEMSAGGGAGGSFVGRGGAGGNGALAAGGPSPLALARAAHGGCPGGSGGSKAGTNGGGGGLGGGLVYFIAGDRLRFNSAARVNASGGPGESGGGTGIGGGGGGSGGFIGLDAPTIQFAAGGSGVHLYALGGGGAPGGEGIAGDIPDGAFVPAQVTNGPAESGSGAGANPGAADGNAGGGSTSNGGGGGCGGVGAIGYATQGIELGNAQIDPLPQAM